MVIDMSVNLFVYLTELFIFMFKEVCGILLTSLFNLYNQILFVLLIW